MLISVAQLNASAERFSSWNKELVASRATRAGEKAIIKSADPIIPSGNIVSPSENLVNRKEMLKSIGQEPADFAFERAIGENDAVYSNFVELIEFAKQKVGRVVIKNSGKTIGYATGFMVAENLLLTNWHVFQNKEMVSDSQVQFFYEYDRKGNPLQAVSFSLDASLFFHSSKELDYCFVAVSPMDSSGAKSLSSIGYIFLNPALGKLGNENEESLNIIHHPDGDFKQLSIRKNLFIKIMPTTIWYQTDTAPGSSGSPVFNDQWQVVALHHMGVPRKNAQGQYLDKNGGVVIPVDGKIDASKIDWEANEGIRISVLLNDLFKQFPDSQIVNSIKRIPQDSSSSVLPGNKVAGVVDQPQNTSNMETNSATDSVTISIPTSLIEAKGRININITQGNTDTRALNIPAASQLPKPASSLSDEELEEIKQLEKSQDFSACKGYQSRFLGQDVPIPQPKAALKKFIAKIQNTDAIVLKYYHYSTIFHSVRMMPAISMINVDGNPDKRKDLAERKDNWLRDKRLDFDIQLSDSYYSGSGFDKGHMSRREDADWGDSPEDAKLFADITCMYTNACPQVAKINQARRKGLWGKLEEVVLEKGVKKESGKTGKISVFNGPVFKDDDPVYKGIQVPLDFYKIILWLTDNGKLKATAFKLSQQNFVADMDLHEEIDIDQNMDFKEFQCSIKSLETATQLDFSAIEAFDTFDNVHSHEVAINSEEEVRAFVKKHNKK
jgi:endonuclease G, mitochondrial